MKIEHRNLFTHFIFTVIHREPLISEKHRIRIEKYITGIVNHNDSKLYAIYANPEHLHFLVSRSPSITEEQLATKVADSSEYFINKEQLCEKHFAWQQTAAAYSVSKKEVDHVCQYILNQKEHHFKVGYQEECDMFLKIYMEKIKPK
jgi:putative transposase